MKKSSVTHPATSRKTSKKSHPLSSLLLLMKKQKGFTLIELMIAMAIIAILATAGISAYTGYLKKSRDTARAQIAQNLNTAVMSYAASNGGNPPASNEAFTQFLASAGEVFSGSGVTSTTLVVDPVGGKDVCLDAAGAVNQPCRFDYTAYSDGTYAISYGVEHESSAEGNFYKTTRSVADPADTNNPPTIATTKYGVYIGSAPYIGSPVSKAADATAQTNLTGVDVSYTPTESSAAITMAAPLFLARRIDAPTVTSGGGDTGGGTGIAANGNCALGDQCATGLVCSPISSTCKKICGSGTIRARDDRCWYTTNLGGDGALYQWGRDTTAFTNAPNEPYDWSDPQDPTLWTDTGGTKNPCPSLSHVPSIGEWQALIDAETAVGVTDLTNSTLALPKADYIYYSNGLRFNTGTSGFYWSSSPSVSDAYYIAFSSGDSYISHGYRAFGFSVRCIVN